MRKTVTTVVLALSCLLAFQVGSAFASSKLEETIRPLIGIDYNYGGTTTAGFDCSGFTSYVFKQFGIELERSSKDQYSSNGTKVARDELRAGDLVFFNTSGEGVSHVGIYMGNNKFAHASSSKGITISDMDDAYYAQRYVGARRVLGDDLYRKIAVDPDDK